MDVGVERRKAAERLKEMKPDGRMIDEFDPGSLERSLNKVMSMADAVMVD